MVHSPWSSFAQTRCGEQVLERKKECLCRARPTSHIYSQKLDNESDLLAHASYRSTGITNLRRILAHIRS